MKKLILVVSFITGSIFMANAQVSHKSPEQRASHMTKHLQKKLNLSSDQVRQVDAIFMTQATRMDSLKASHPADKKAVHVAARGIRQTTENNIAAVLNDTQKQQFMAWVKARKDKHREHKEAPETK